MKCGALRWPILKVPSCPIIQGFSGLGKDWAVINNATADNANSSASVSASDRARILIQVHPTPKASSLPPGPGKEKN